jgi:type IV secretion system protein VirB8
MNEKNAAQLYFGKACTWADDLRASETRSRNRYQAAFFASMGLNVVIAIAVAVLANYQTVVPLLVNHYDNGVTVVSAIPEKKAVTNQSQIESDLVRYVLHREAFDETSYRAQYELVTLLSNNTTAQEYVREQSKSNAQSPIAILGHTHTRSVHVYSVHFIDRETQNEKDMHQDHHNVAEVVFQLTDTDKSTGKSTQTPYTALISWRYTTPPDSPALRWQNWNGFEITRYSKQVQHVETLL